MGEVDQQEKARQLKASESSESGQEGKTISPPPFGLAAGAIQRKREENESPMSESSGSSKSGGMPGEVQAKMENSFGTDFSGVNIHENSSSATDMGALAYTQGNDVHFAPGQFKPESQGGQELIGHELTHVVQQREGNIKPTTEVGGMGVNNDASLENEADVKGKQAAQAKFAGGEGGGFSPASAASSSVVQRYSESPVEYNHDGHDMSADREQELQGQTETAMSERSSRDAGRELTEGQYTAEVQSLQSNVNAAYRSMKAGYEVQMAAFLEAHNNMKGVLAAVSKHEQQMAVIAGIFLSVVTGVAGGLVSGMMTGIMARTLGGRAGSWLNLGQAAQTTLNTSLAGGVIDGIKGVISLGAGASAVPDATGMTQSPGFSDPASASANGISTIDAEWSYFAQLIQTLTNYREECMGANVRPSAILGRYANQLASKQTAGASASSGSDTKAIEKALWRSWISANGTSVQHGYMSSRTVLDVHKYILEHVSDDLGVSEGTVRSWAGL